MKAKRVKGLRPEGTLAENARRIVAVRADELVSFLPRVLDPTEVLALHDMRIAAKRLRYVLEVTGPALGPTAAEGVREAKGLQGLLGEIHDCDVMLPLLAEHLDRLQAEDAAAVRERADAEATDLKVKSARDTPNHDRYEGVHTLVSYYRARREVLFVHFLAEIGRLERERFHERLIEGMAEAGAEGDDAADAGDAGSADGPDAGEVHPDAAAESDAWADVDDEGFADAPAEPVPSASRGANGTPAAVDGDGREEL